MRTRRHAHSRRLSSPTGSQPPRFAVEDVQAEFDRLSAKGVTFVQPPTAMGPVTTAVFDDTCGNLIQIASLAA